MNFPISRRVTPTIDTAIYASGDQIGPASTELSQLNVSPNGLVLLSGIKVIDKDKEKAALDVLLFNSQPTNSTADNAALDISDAEMVAKYVGHISVAAADYKDLAGSSVACVILAQPLQLKMLRNTANKYGTSLWFTIASRGTPTYTTNSDLTLVFEFL